jgi:hypothetical protein
VASRDDYVLEAFMRSLRRGVAGFGKESLEVQHHLATLILDSSLKRRRHKKYDGYMAVTYQELYGKFGRTGFQDLNERLGLFEVLEHWSKDEKYTKGYKLTGKVQAIRSRFLNAGIRKLDNLVGGDGKYLRTPPKAVASKDMDGITASKWKHTQFKSTVPVDIPALKRLSNRLKAIKKDMDAGRWNCDLFFKGETSDWVEYCLEVIAQVLRLAHTKVAGEGYLIHRYVESQSGRLYARKINLQTAPKAVKQAALHDLWEYDFENCHYAIFYQLAGQAGVECPNIQHYLAHKEEVRSRIAREVQITQEQTKVCLLAIMYGARASGWHESAIPEMIADKAQRLYEYPLFAGLMCEIKAGREAILNRCPKGRTTYMNAMGKRIRKNESAEQILAHLIQGIEAKMLHIALDLYPKQILLLQHDGFAASEKLDRRRISESIKAQTGFDMDLSEERIRLSESLIFSKT